MRINSLLASLFFLAAPTNLSAQAVPDEIKSILDSNCSKCHGERSAEKKATAKIPDIFNLADIIRRGHIVPGDPLKSPLYTTVLSNEMPDGAEYFIEDPVPEEDKERLKAWITSMGGKCVHDRPFISDGEILGFIFDDLAEVSTERAKSFRYFALTNLHNNACIAENELQTYREAVAKMVNSLSWQRSITKPRPIDPTGSILRVNIKRLGWSAEQWDSLAESSPYAKFYDTIVSNAVSAALEVNRPYVRADWFVAKVSKPPLYHEFAEIPETAKELEQRLLNGSTADDALLDNPYDVVRAGISQGNSGVSQQNRMLERHFTSYGAYWRSFDFAAVDQNDPQTAKSRNFFNTPTGPTSIDQHGFAHDGGEMIFNLPNGMQAYMLVDSQGKRIDIGPISIVQDDTSFELTRSREIINGISCIACHAGGMRDSRIGSINAERDELLDHVSVAGFPNSILDSVTELHRPSDMKLYWQQDTERYLAALERTGVPRNKATVSAEPVSILVGQFNNQNVDVRMAAAELGIRLKDFENILETRFENSPELRSIRNRLKSSGIPREQFIAEFGRLAEALNIASTSDATARTMMKEVNSKLAKENEELHQNLNALAQDLSVIQDERSKSSSLIHDHFFCSQSDEVKNEAVNQGRYTKRVAAFDDLMEDFFRAIGISRAQFVYAGLQSISYERGTYPSCFVKLGDKRYGNCSTLFRVVDQSVYCKSNK